VTAEEAAAAAQVADLEDMLDRPSEKDKPCSGETTNREEPAGMMRALGCCALFRRPPRRRGQGRHREQD
jgi:hypothetical protein